MSCERVREKREKEREKREREREINEKRFALIRSVLFVDFWPGEEVIINGSATDNQREPRG